MSSDSYHNELLCHYYLLVGYYRKVQDLANLANGNARSSEPGLSFWKGVAIWQEGIVSGGQYKDREAIRELEVCQEQGGGRDWDYAITGALAWFHSKSTNPDRDCVQKYTSQSENHSRNASDEGKVNMGLFYLFVGEIRKAKEIAISLTPNGNTAAFVARTYYMEAQTENQVTKEEITIDQIVQYCKFNFPNLTTPHQVITRCLALVEQNVIADNQTSSIRISQLDGLMLKASLMSSSVSKNWPTATEYLNQILVYFPWYTPALMEKAKIQVSSGEWELALETCTRLDEAEPTGSIDSVKIHLLHLLTIGKIGKNSNRGGGGPGGGGFFDHNSSLHDDISAKLDQLFQLLKTKEPLSGHLLVDNVKLFSGLVGRNSRLLGKLQQVMQQYVDTVTSRTRKESSVYLTELGNQYLLMENASVAAELFREASTRDDSNVSCIYGTLHCRILEGAIEDASEQLEFFRDAHGSELGTSNNKSRSTSSYLSSLVARSTGNHAQALQLLNETLTIHISDFRNSSGYEFYTKLAPDFMQQIATEYIAAHDSTSGQEGGGESPTSGSGARKTSTQLTRAIQVLETLAKFIPGNLSAQTMLARAKLWNGQHEEALRILDSCLQVDPSYTPCYLLMARTYFEQNEIAMSLRILEQGMSRDFSIRTHPLYSLIKATSIHLERGGGRDQAIRTLEETMNQPEVKHATKRGTSDATVKTGSTETITIQDRVAIFLLLSKLYAQSGRLGEAQSLLNTASTEFKGTREEAKIVVAQAQHYVEKGDIDKGLSTLLAHQQTVGFSRHLKQEEANIYLKYKHNTKMFAQCYKDIVNSDPNNVNNYMILGNALLEICEPEDAIKAFERALALSSQDANDPNKKSVAIDSNALVRKIGSALVLTHDYESAKNYYTSALQRDPTAIDLRIDLAHLHSKLENYQDAVQELEDALHVCGSQNSTNSSNQSDNTANPTVQVLRTKIQILKKLANVHLEASYSSNAKSDGSIATGEGGQPVPAAADKLKQATELQKQLMERLRLDDDENVRKERNFFAELCFTLADYFDKRERDFQQATDYYNECLRCDESHEKAILGLSKIHMANGNYEACERQLMMLLRMDSRSEAAVEGSTLMAELLMILAANGTRSEGGLQEYRDATFHYRQLLEKKPGDWNALSRLLYLLKRSGNLRDFEKYLSAAESHCSATRNVEMEPGYRYCKGLYESYMNKPSDALVNLNFARTRDAEFRRDASLAMINIYLFPDPNKTSLESLQDISQESHSEQHYREVELLIQELYQTDSTVNRIMPRLRVLQAQNCILTKKKSEVDRGLQLLVELYNEDKNFVPGLLAMSQGLIISKQLTKARNQLKRITEIARKAYNPLFSDDFEKSWLLLADIYIQGGKCDLASQLCNLASTHNRSSGRAWENLGLIFEKEHSYREAATHYEKAWELCNRNSPNVGFRLAFNYLKAKRLLECVLICRQVLKINANYPKIQKEILDKARAQIRV